MRSRVKSTIVINMDDDDDDGFTTFSDILRSPASERNPSKINRKSNQFSPVRNPIAQTHKDIEDSPRASEEQSHLIESQLLKVDLLKKKELLIEKRQELHDKIEKLKRGNRKLKETSQNLITEKTLEALIEQNNTEFATEFEKRLQKNKRSETDDSWAISKELMTEPSADWELRLKYIKRFLVHILFLHAKVFTEIKDSKQLRIYSMYAYAEDLFKVPLTLMIDAGSLSIQSIKPAIYEKAILGQKKLRSVAILSPQFHKILMEDYIPNKKIHCIVQGLNSLAVAVHERTKIMKDVISKFSKYIVPTHRLSETVVASIINMSKQKILLTLKDVDTLKFEIPSSGSHPSYVLTINWIILSNNQMTGQCGSVLSVVLEGEKNLQDITSIFMKLMKDSGVVGGLCILFKNLFDIPV